MGELIRIKRVDENAPNMIAVINLFDNNPPARGYILNINIEKVFGSVEKAAEYLERKIRFFHRLPDPYLVGFAWGNKYGKEASEMWPFEKSNSDGNLIKIKPFLVGVNGMDRSPPYLKGEFVVVTGIEENYRKRVPFDQFIKNPPKISGLEYAT